MFKDYYRLAKPGIVYGNALTVIAGFILGSTTGFRFDKFFLTVLGVCLVIAGACAANNVLDKNIDKKMNRTRNRAVPAGRISPAAANTYSVILTLVGLAILYLVTSSWLVPLLGIIAWILYVFVYGYAKRTTPLSTLIGTVPGALPPVAGYAAASGKIDLAALLLFIILVSWQMPHFYAVAIFRRDDYKKARLPLISVLRSSGYIRKQIILFCILFIACSSLLSIFGYTGLSYFVAILALGLIWLKKCLEALNSNNEQQWARGVFGYSLVVLLVFSAVTSATPYLP